MGRYRIDVVTGRRLIEIQFSGLAAIARKIAELVKTHRVDVIKPITLRKKLIKLDGRQGKILGTRWSNLRGSPIDLFEELIAFRHVFPHPRLRLVVPLLEIEETRFPGHGRRRRWRERDFQVADRRVLKWCGCLSFGAAHELLQLLPDDLSEIWDTQELASKLGITRALSQRVAYVLRHIGAAAECGKRGHSRLHRLVRRLRTCKETCDEIRSLDSKPDSGWKPKASFAVPMLRMGTGPAVRRDFTTDVHPGGHGEHG